MLAYTINKLLTQQAVIQRDLSTSDRYGSKAREDWQTISTSPCVMWWWHESARGPAKEFASAQRTVAMNEGGFLFPVGTDVTEDDQVLQINDLDGNMLVHGPFDISAVENPPGALFVQAYWIRP